MGLLDGRVAIISGAGSGIGRTTALTFAGEGATVVATDINEDSSLETAALLESEGAASCLGLRLDVTDPADVGGCVSRTVEEFGRVDILVNNAGLQWGATDLSMTPEDWNGVIDLNLSGQFFLIRAVLPHMKTQKYGKLIGIASDAGRFRSYGSTYAYAAAKGGVHGLHRSVAEEAGPWNITANVVSPGNVMTERGRRFMAMPGMDETLKECPMGRWTEPEEIANAVLFFASDLSSHVTGVTMSVNGGWHMVW